MLIKVSVAAVVFPPHTLAMLVAPQTAYRAYSLGPTWKSVAYTALFGGAKLAVSR